MLKAFGEEDEKFVFVKKLTCSIILCGGNTQLLVFVNVEKMF